jgi:long-chain acyl-CoA synthetase
MNSSDALLHAWDKTWKAKGASPAVFDPRGRFSRSFADIETDAGAYDRRLEQFEGGAVVAIQIGNHPDWPALLIACLRRHLVVLPLEQSITPTDRDIALMLCHAAGLIIAGEADGRALEILRFAPGPISWGERPPSLLKLTSGTTAAPRAVRFRADQLVADCQQICSSMAITDEDVNFGVVPVSHSYGFSNLITPLLVCGVPMVISRDRLPRAVIEDIARSGATVFPGMPVFYQAFCEMTEVPKLPRLRLCISAGAPLTAALARRFHENFKVPLHSFYGASECGGICYDRDGTRFEDGFVGPPMDNVDLEFRDDDAAPGRVRVRSAAVGDGYFPQPDEDRLGGRAFVPDDLLVRSVDGFRIVGRSSDVINVAGRKVNPAQVEEQLLRFAGVRAAVAFGRRSAQRNEEVVACVVSDRPVAESALLEFCRRQLSGWQVPRRIFFLDAIPVNERGKISRRELAERFTA